MNRTRRTALQQTGAWALLLAAGVLTAGQARAALRAGAAAGVGARAGFEAQTLEAALQALGGAVARQGEIDLTTPDIAENGAAVPVSVVSRLPGTTDLYLLVEKNPLPLVAAFAFPAGTEPEIQTLVRMAESSRVWAVVRANGKLYATAREVRVTLGGCGV